jgi:aldose sugar dehydrogenase
MVYYVEMKSFVIAGLVIVLFAIGGVYFTSNRSQKIHLPSMIKETVNKNGGVSRVTDSVDYDVEVFAENLYVPWSIVFTSDSRLLVSERDGKIRVINDGNLSEEPLHVFQEVSSDAEEGLMGMTLDPDYGTNRLIYVCYAYRKGSQLVDKVVQVQDQGDSVEILRTIIDAIPAARFHAGCRIKFGPDNKLYITTGDATNKQLAQNLDSLAGKILRINSDGSIPEDNPFPGSPIWSLGHRNPQGIDWHPESKELWSTEHGPSGFDGPGGGDEVNAIVQGGNYGWPKVSHEEIAEPFEAPKIVYTPAAAPASGHFYYGTQFPQFTNNFLFGGLQTEGIHRVVLTEDTPHEVILHEEISGIGDVGRVREVTEGPDGYIYFSTSNRDGRGSVRPGDDKIYRLVPRP